MHLLGYKGHKKVLDIVCKVEKSTCKKSQEREDRGASLARSLCPLNMRFYFCNRRGHIKAVTIGFSCKQCNF